MVGDRGCNKRKPDFNDRELFYNEMSLQRTRSKGRSVVLKALKKLDNAKKARQERDQTQLQIGLVVPRGL